MILPVIGVVNTIPCSGLTRRTFLGLSADAHAPTSRHETNTDTLNRAVERKNAMPQKTRKKHSSLSVSDIAKGLGCSRSEVIKSLARLEELKVIERDRTSHKHGGKWKVTGLGKITAAMLEAMSPERSPKDSPAS